MILRDILKISIIVGIALVVNGCKPSEKTIGGEVEKINFPLQKVFSIDSKNNILSLSASNEIVVISLPSEELIRTIPFEYELTCENRCWLTDGYIFGTHLDGDTGSRMFIIKPDSSTIIHPEIAGTNPFILDYNERYIVGYYTDATGQEKPLLFSFEDGFIELDFLGEINTINDDGEFAGTLFDSDESWFYRSSTKDPHTRDLLLKREHGDRDISDISSSGDILIRKSDSVIIFGLDGERRELSYPGIKLVYPVFADGNNVLSPCTVQGEYGIKIGYFSDNFSLYPSNVSNPLISDTKWLPTDDCALGFMVNFPVDQFRCVGVYYWYPKNDESYILSHEDWKNDICTMQCSNAAGWCVVKKIKKSSFYYTKIRKNR